MTGLHCARVILLATLVSLSNGFSAEETPPDRSHGLRLNLTITPRQENGHTVNDVRLQLTNSGTQPVSLVHTWEASHDNPNYENLLQYANFRSDPEVLDRGGMQTTYVPKKIATKEISLPPGSSRFASWTVPDGHIGELNLEEPGVYQIRATHHVNLMPGGHVTLESNAVALSARGGTTPPRAPSVKITAVDREKKFVELSAGTTRGVQVGDIFDVFVGGWGPYWVCVTQAEPERAKATVEFKKLERTDRANWSRVRTGAMAARTTRANLVATELIEAIQSDKKEIVRRILAETPEAVRVNRRWGAVYYAAQEGKLDILQLLIEAGLPMDGEHVADALNVALRNGRPDVVKCLLEKGVKANGAGRDTWGGWASKLLPNILAAAQGGKEASLRMLLERGVDVNLKGVNNETALHIAARNGSLACLKLLLEHGAAPNAVMTNGVTPAHLAARFSGLGALEVLEAKGADLLALDNEGRSTLSYAAETNKNDVTEWLAQKGVSWDPVSAAQSNKLDVLEAKRVALPVGQTLFSDTNATGRTLLHDAVKRGDKARVQYLLDNGAVLEARDKYDRTALHWAASRGQTEIATLLLERGAEINPPDGLDSWTPLHIALHFERSEIVKLLLEKNPVLNAGSVTGATPLHIAAKSGHLEFVTLLLNAGADANLTDKYGNLPLHHALEALASQKGDEFFEGLSRRERPEVEFDGYSGDQNDMYRTPQGPPIVRKCAQLLLEKTRDVNLVPAGHASALHTVVGKLDVEMVDALLTRGANPNATGWENERPLHYISEYSGWNRDEDRKKERNELRWSIADKLLKKGAEIEAANVHGWTPLHRSIERGDQEYAGFLLEHGAKLTVRDLNGRTPLLVAALYDSAEMVSFLNEKGGVLKDVDKWGQTALILALLGKTPNDPYERSPSATTALIQLLIDKGVDTTAKDTWGRSAIDCAHELKKYAESFDDGGANTSKFVESTTEILKLMEGAKR